MQENSPRPMKTRNTDPKNIGTCLIATKMTYLGNKNTLASVMAPNLDSNLKVFKASLLKLFALHIHLIKTVNFFV